MGASGIMRVVWVTCLSFAPSLAFCQHGSWDDSVGRIERDLSQAMPAAYSAAAYDDMLRRLRVVEDKLLETECKVDDGWEDVSNEKWTHSVGGRALVETVMWPNDAAIGENYTEIRQVRLAMRGNGYGVYDYRVQVDFEPETTFVDGDDRSVTVGSIGMKDVYVGMHEIPILGYVRTGHFKVPFSHDQMLGRRDMTFMERTPMADPDGFTPGREVGVAAFSHSRDQNVTWGYGAFFDSISETSMQRVDDAQGLVAGGRVTWTPLFDEPSDGRYIVHLGLGALYTDPQDDSGRFRQRPETHEGPIFIDTGAIRSNQHLMLNTELLVHYGPFYVNSEFWATNVNDDTGRTDLYSAYVEVGWFLTGEHRNYDRKNGLFVDLEPYENFWLVPGCLGLGAWEIAARWSYVDFTRSPNESTYNSLNLALNWYLNPRTRVQVNWNMPNTDGAPLGNRNASILGLRLAGYF